MLVKNQDNLFDIMETAEAKWLMSLIFYEKEAVDMAFYDSMFDMNNDGILDGGEFGLFMDFMDEMDRDGLNRNSSSYGGYDPDIDDYDGFGGDDF